MRREILRRKISRWTRDETLLANEKGSRNEWLGGVGEGEGRGEGRGKMRVLGEQRADFKIHSPQITVHHKMN